MHISPPRLVLLGLAMVVASAGPSAAQYSSSEVKTKLYDPSAPDGRSLALAGTGIAMPDDATAVMTNPAGLRLLVRKELISTAGIRRLDFDVMEGQLPEVLSPETLPLTRSRLNYTELFFAYAHPGRRIGAGAFYRVHYRSSDTWFQYGGSVAVSIREDLSIGATLNIDQLTANTSTSSGEQLKPAMHVGVSYSPHSRVHVGVVHRRGVVHDFATPINVDPITFEYEFREYQLNLPDVTGAGVGFFVTDQTRVLAEMSRTRYSQLAPAYAARLLPIGEDLDDVTIADSTELRLAIEQSIAVGTKALQVRGGVWREHAHPVTYVGADPIRQALFPPDDKSRVHLTAGVGLSAEYFGVSVGADVARDFNRLLATAVVRFR